MISHEFYFHFIPNNYFKTHIIDLHYLSKEITFKIFLKKDVVLFFANSEIVIHTTEKFRNLSDTLI